MPEVIVKYENAGSLHALEDFAKYFEIVIAKHALKRKAAFKPKKY